MSKKLTNEELFAQFEGIGDEAEPATSKKPPSKPITSPSTKQPDPDDLFQELGIPERPKAPISRPHTPKVSSSTTTPALRSSPKRNSTATPPSSDAARSSEDRALPRKSVESTRSFHNSFTPKTDNSAEPENVSQKDTTFIAEAAAAESQAQSSGGGWWGGLFSTATSAISRAEALAKEIRANEEAQRWASQVQSNVGALRGLGGELRSRALPTFTNILHSLAPPISAHERLQIHLTHDIIGYPSLDPLIYRTFERVMAQVEGGDLMVIQRGQESSRRRPSVDGFTGSGSNSGWSDGPWWRHSSGARNLGAVKGLTEGAKLSKASAESYANEYYSTRGGLEEAAKQATEVLSESNPTRSSDIFLAFQAITHSSTSEVSAIASDPPKAVGQEPGHSESEKDKGKEVDGNDELLTFAIYLHDPVHGITYSTFTQPLPAQWTSWLDTTPTSDSETSDSALPEEIAPIILSGGVDPREWVAEWIEEVLVLGVGVMAQRYVARRMGVGVGTGGLGAGRKRYEVEDSGAGEGARVV
ncbi:MAG: hypothetical protein HETSPECPRED_001233 [Heterodermia speciosa]|uniref:Maintenance of telomere capping protein 1 n=1 Tax=Heterodermia speciosa TaxID=116794 RepID=A0A8H3EZ19_9LECA|nr:MAG: hypothetical protein HETSPECPRED_001233 [Heterodermia speciosa]